MDTNIICTNCHGSGKVRDQDHLLGIVTCGFNYLLESQTPDYKRCDYCRGTGVTKLGREILANRK